MLFELSAGPGGARCGRAGEMPAWTAKTVHGEGNPAHGHRRATLPTDCPAFEGTTMPARTGMSDQGQMKRAVALMEEPYE